MEDTGPKGTTWSQGPRKSVSGDNRDTGPIRPKGPKGDKDDIGPMGLTCPQGPKCDQGNTGPIGPKEDKGDTVSQGPRDTIGERGHWFTRTVRTARFGRRKGDKSEKGDTGSQGPEQGTERVQKPKSEKEDLSSSGFSNFIIVKSNDKISLTTGNDRAWDNNSVIFRHTVTASEKHHIRFHLTLLPTRQKEGDLTISDLVGIIRH